MSATFGQPIPSSSTGDRPSLRLVDVQPGEHRGERFVWLSDSSDPELRPLRITARAVPILHLLDGSNTTGEIRASLAAEGVTIEEAELVAFLKQLDESGYLEGERAQATLRERQRAYQAQPLRQARFAGDDRRGAYPESVGQLAAFLASGYLHGDGPRELPTRPLSPPPTPRGLIAPHVDLHRGAPTYSWAYRTLAESQPAELYIVLGTCHRPVEGHFAASRKPYDTPLGAVPTDPRFLERLAAHWGHDLYAGEFSHAAEHSIEFQAVYLRSLGLAGEGAAPMVAILCDSLHSMVLPPHSPRDVALVSTFLDALKAAIAEDGRRVTIIAAVDLAHVGNQFGDRWKTDGQNMDRVGRHDREMLDLVLATDAEGYFRQVMRDQDARRICGFTPIYLLTELMAAEQRRGDLLRYTQWVAPDLSSSVTFASAIFR